jgi:ligand-binding sensor domain-containing protein
LKRILVFTFLSIVTFWRGYSQEPIFRHYEIGSSSHEIALNCAVEDPFGMIWVGSARGLYSFDGSSFHFQSFEDSSIHDITALFCDSTILLIGCRDGKLAHRSVKIWKKGITIDTSFGAAINGISTDNEHTVWIATYGNGLFVKTKDQVLHFSASNGLAAGEIYCMKPAAGSMVWLGTDEGLSSCQLNNGQVVIKNYTTANGLPDQIVQALAVDSKNDVWVGTYSAGVCMFDPQSQMFLSLPFSSQWKFGSVTGLSISDNRRLMIGTNGSGLLSVSLDDVSHVAVLNESNGYSNAKISSIMLDQEGNFWVTTQSSGLDLIPGLFEWVQGYSKSTQAILLDHSHILWVANDSGLFQLRTSGPDHLSSKIIRLRPGKKAPVITSMYEDHDENIWIATMGEGVFVLLKEKFPALHFTESDGLANNSVLSVNGNGEFIWIATLGGVSRCNLLRNKEMKPTFENFRGKNGIRSNYVYQVLIDSKKRVWFATDGDGLQKLEQGKFSSVRDIDSFHIKTVYSIAEDGKGNIWFSTMASGIFRFDGKNYQHFGESEDISDLNITGIIADANNDIVILEHDGIEVLESRTDQIRRYRGRPFFDGINPGINAFFKDSFQNIWIATELGILKYYPLNRSFSDEARLELVEVQVDLQPIDFSELHKFSYNQNHFAFDYQGFWNFNPSQIRYRYQLEGYDPNWIKTKDERVNYPNMPAGTYTFKVQGTIHHNFNDAITRSYSFTITPPFWKTWWFIISSSLAGVIIVFLFVKWREHEVKKGADLKRKNLEFQLENLKTQINPHFLFNSFNTLIAIIEEDQNLAMEYVENLSDFYRSTLKYKDVDLISLRDEIELISSFIFLLTQRHGKNLRVSINISEEDYNQLIPPLTLQLLIENAVKHNVVSREDPLFVEIFMNENHQLSVRNNLQRRDESVVSTQIGLKNISSRFKILGGKPAEIVVTDKFYQVTMNLFKP